MNTGKAAIWIFATDFFFWLLWFHNFSKKNFAFSSKMKITLKMISKVLNVVEKERKKKNVPKKELVIMSKNQNIVSMTCDLLKRSWKLALIDYVHHCLSAYTLLCYCIHILCHMVASFFSIDFQIFFFFFFSWFFFNSKFHSFRLS